MRDIGDRGICGNLRRLGRSRIEGAVRGHREMHVGERAVGASEPGIGDTARACGSGERQSVGEAPVRRDVRRPAREHRPERDGTRGPILPRHGERDPAARARGVLLALRSIQAHRGGIARAEATGARDLVGFAVRGRRHADDPVLLTGDRTREPARPVVDETAVGQLDRPCRLCGRRSPHRPPVLIGRVGLNVSALDPDTMPSGVAIASA